MKPNGFTLLEVLVSVIILATAMVVLSSSTGGSVAMNRKGQDLDIITFLMKRALTQTEVKYGGTNVKSVPEGPEDHEFDEPEYKAFTWRLESKKMEFPDFSSVLTSQKGGVDEMTLSMVQQMVTKVSEAVKEVRITILRKVRTKTFEYPITFYMVDHSMANILGAAGAAAAGGGATAPGGTGTTNPTSPTVPTGSH